MINKMNNLHQIKSEMEKEFDEKFAYFKEIYGEELTDIKHFIFQDYTEKIVESIREEVEKERDKWTTGAATSALTNVLSLLSSLIDKYQGGGGGGHNCKSCCVVCNSKHAEEVRISLLSSL